MTDIRPWDLHDDEDYANYITGLSPEDAIMLMLRESRFVSCFFPAYTSGAGDLIGDWMNALRTEWGLPQKEY